MVKFRVVLLAGAAVALSACNSLPVPDYVSVKTPPAYRVAPDGLKVDNEDYAMDAQGYRIDKKGERVGDVDVRAKMGNESTNAMAGYYDSTRGAYVPGKVAGPSEGAAAGAGYGPGSAGVTPAAMPGAAPAPAAPAPAATGAPVPLQK
jgi:hypothetical protein